MHQSPILSLLTCCITKREKTIDVSEMCLNSSFTTLIKVNNGNELDEGMLRDLV